MEELYMSGKASLTCWKAKCGETKFEESLLADVYCIHTLF